MFACKISCLEVVKFLSQFEMHIVADKNGQTALMYSCMRDIMFYSAYYCVDLKTQIDIQLEIVKMLIH